MITVYYNLITNKNNFLHLFKLGFHWKDGSQDIKHINCFNNALFVYYYKNSKIIYIYDSTNINVLRNKLRNYYTDDVKLIKMNSALKLG